MLTPTGTWCEDAWLATAALITQTSRLKFLVAFRPGLISPTLAAQMAASYQRISRGRLLLNVVTGGQAEEQRRFGDHLSHDERYARTGEFLAIVRGAWGRDNAEIATRRANAPFRWPRHRPDLLPEPRGRHQRPARAACLRGDGKRIYLTNSLYGAWDDQFYPDGVGSWFAKLDTDPAHPREVGSVRLGGITGSTRSGWGAATRPPTPTATRLNNGSPGGGAPASLHPCQSTSRDSQPCSATWASRAR